MNGRTADEKEEREDKNMNKKSKSRWKRKM